jgi:DNA-binding transcriptional ArsR family regulator
MRTDPLSLTFAALADPTRRAILSRLASGEASVSELAEPFRMSLPAVSKHLKVLQRAGLVTQTREAQWRPCRIAPEPLRDVASWVDDYRRLWEARLQRFEAYLRSHPEREPEAAGADVSKSPPAIRRIGEGGASSPSEQSQSRPRTPRRKRK